MILIDAPPDDPTPSIKEFFEFPFAKDPPVTEDVWFEQHLQYLKLLMGKKQFDSSLYQKLTENVKKFEILKYKKSFNIFPNGKFEDTAFFAVIDMWKSNALVRLRS